MLICCCIKKCWKKFYRTYHSNDFRCVSEKMIEKENCFAKNIKFFFYRKFVECCCLYHFTATKENFVQILIFFFLSIFHLQKKKRINKINAHILLRCCDEIFNCYVMLTILYGSGTVGENKYATATRTKKWFQSA